MNKYNNYWYYEFNDDCFYLKIKNSSVEKELIRTLKNQIDEIEALSTLERVKTRIRFGEYMTISKWKVKWDDIGSAACEIVNLTEILESNILIERIIK